MKTLLAIMTLIAATIAGAFGDTGSWSNSSMSNSSWTNNSSSIWSNELSKWFQNNGGVNTPDLLNKFEAWLTSNNISVDSNCFANLQNWLHTDNPGSGSNCLADLENWFQGHQQMSGNDGSGCDFGSSNDNGSENEGFDGDHLHAVPEPSSIILFASGTAITIATTILRRRRC